MPKEKIQTIKEEIKTIADEEEVNWIEFLVGFIALSALNMFALWLFLRS